MKLTEHQYQRIADSLPRQRGNVSMTNLRLLNALLYMVEHGCKWRGLPKEFGNWHTIYTRMNRWSKAGVLDRVFARLQQEQILASAASTCAWIAPRSKCIPLELGPLKKRAASHRALPGRMHH
jgi:transposase